MQPINEESEEKETAIDSNIEHYLQNEDENINDIINRHPVKSPLEKVRSIFFLQKSVLMGLTFIPQKIRVVIGSSCRRFLQPKNARL